MLGGASMMREPPIEKYQRDAASFLHSDGTNQFCLMRAIRAIAGGVGASEYGF